MKAAPGGLLGVAAKAAAATLPLPPPPDTSAHSQQCLAAEQQRRLELWLEQPIVPPGAPAAATPASASEATGSDAAPGSAEWWEALLLSRAESQLRSVQRRRLIYQQIVADLGLQSARVAAQIVLAATPAPAASSAPSTQRPPRPQRSLVGQTRRRSDTDAVAAVAPVVPRAAAAAAGGHNPATCRVKNCLRCAAHARMLANVGQQGAAAQAPLGPQQRQQQQQQQQQGAAQTTNKRVLRQRRRSSTPSSPAPNGHASAGAAAGQQTAAAAAASPQQELAAAYPHLDPQICAAVCAAFPGAPALGEAQRAMAAWLAGSGARSPGEVVSVLDSSQQVWGMALAATDGAGAKLVHWVALLNGCKQAAGM